MLSEIGTNDVHRIFQVPLNEAYQYRVRPMHEADLASVLMIERETWGSVSWSSNDFLHALKNPLYSCWILERIPNDYRILGYGLQLSAGDISHIANICLHRYRRGRGLGGILLRHMIDHARETKTSMVELDVHTFNTRAYRLYTHHGFRIIAYQYQYYSDCADAYKMRLIL